MGSTLDEMQAGSTSYVYVLAIEGYPFLLTTGAPAAAVAAWEGTDWTQALGGLYVNLNNQQLLDPWKPFAGGGTLELKVAPDPAAAEPDQFGIDLARTLATPESELAETIDRTSSAIVVGSTDGFDSTGEAYIGNECFAYSGKSATAFEVTRRGKYSPFTAHTGGTTWGEFHRAGLIDTTTPIHPLVVKYRRVWVGAWVGLWAHRVVNGVLDTRDQAQLVFAGQLADHVDDSGTACSVVHCIHVLDVLAKVTLLRDQFRCTLADGIYLGVNPNFDGDFLWGDQIGGTIGEANGLSIVASGATGTNEINAGWYTTAQLCAAINTWLAAETAASRLSGHYTLSIRDLSVVGSGDTASAAFVIDTAGAGGGLATFGFAMPYSAAALLGLADSKDAGRFADRWGSANAVVAGVTIVDVTTYSFTPGDPVQFDGTPLRMVFGSQSGIIIPAKITTTSGSFFEQYDLLPSQYKISPKPAPEWGMFLVNGQNLMVAGFDGDEIVITWFIAGGQVDLSLQYGSTETIELAQIAALSSTWSDLLLLLFRSSGVTGYNDASYDILPFGLGVGLPASLAPDPTFADSITGQDAADAVETLWIRKTTKLAEILTVDLVLRGVHLVWKNGGLRFVQWHTPGTGELDPADAMILDESTKGEPAGNASPQRPTTMLATQWAHPVVALNVDYDPATDSFRLPITLEDGVAIDDNGGTSDPLTMDCRSMSPATIDEILPLFVSRWCPFMSRPVPLITRSITPCFYEGRAPGDFAEVSDDFARDPNTGRRGIIAQGALVIRHQYSPGGLQPGTGVDGEPTVTPPQGEVDVIVFPGTSRAALYSPAAEVDSTASSSGFSAGYDDATKTLRFLAHEHTRAGAAVDASYFAALDKVRIIEVDPDAPASPDTWTRTISSISGSDVVLTVALSSPAWNAAKRYRMVPDHFTVVQATQALKAFEADDATGLIESGTVPFLYALPPTQPAISPISHTALAERHAELADGDGKPRDVGHDAALARTINNIIDHKTAHQTPFLDDTERANDAVAGWVLTYCRKVYVGVGTVGITGPPGPGAVIVQRAFSVAPFFRSKSGTSSLRVTLCRQRPTATSYTNVTFTGAYSQQTWSTSSSTYVTGAEADLDLSVRSNYGWAWLCVELGQHAATRGLAQAVERERSR